MHRYRLGSVLALVVKSRLAACATLEDVAGYGPQGPQIRPGRVRMQRKRQFPLGARHKKARPQQRGRAGPIETAIPVG
jgi:hypothetical protein